ncbi:hypothetical protein FPHYL_520 [Fusarium phyllophilum]|uniref:Uncharacterized protein n=1 Tax=Fusarium phyllophilum TaxID=47803 RepID=A0A8H5NMT0_9HYPO|nr:hypothetical protein FPHYL_520 [Fusarium phyllophilum]
MPFATRVYSTPIIENSVNKLLTLKSRQPPSLLGRSCHAPSSHDVHIPDLAIVSSAIGPEKEAYPLASSPRVSRDTILPNWEITYTGTPHEEHMSHDTVIPANRVYNAFSGSRRNDGLLAEFDATLDLLFEAHAAPPPVTNSGHPVVVLVATLTQVPQWIQQPHA